MSQFFVLFISMIIILLYSLSIEDLEENDELYANELDGRSPYYRQRHKLRATQRQNRIRGILTKQLKSKNESLIDEQYSRLKSRNISFIFLWISNLFIKEKNERTN